MAEKRRPCAKCGRNRAERFFTGPRGRTCLSCRKGRSRASAHGARIGRTYNLTAAEYDALLVAQGGACAICGETRSYRLNVDHCHRTGRIRGLLCRLHNGRLLPAAKDRPEILRAAADYLENPPALAVIGERLVPDGERQPRRGARRNRGRRRGHDAAAA